MRHAVAFIVSLLLSAAARAQESKAPLEAKAFDWLVGVWKTDVTEKPAKWTPEEKKRRLEEVTSRMLGGRFALSREISSDGGKSLWITGHDSKTGSYPVWIFNNKGLHGGEWLNTWDDKAKTLSGQAKSLPQGWTSGAGNRFPGRNTNLVHFWIKDETGALMLDGEAKKVRQAEAAADKILAEWSKANKPLESPSALKVLERLTGSWEADVLVKPSEWIPKETRTTTQSECVWALDGQHLQSTTKSSDGKEGYSLLTYDAQRKAYRTWFFSSDGDHDNSEGQWDAAVQTLNFKADLDGGLSSRGTMRFIDDDRHVFKVQVKDRADKLYFDGEWTVTRRKK